MSDAPLPWRRNNERRHHLISCIETLNSSTTWRLRRLGVLVVGACHRVLAAAEGSGRADGSRHQRSFGFTSSISQDRLVGAEAARLAEIPTKGGSPHTPGANPLHL